MILSRLVLHPLHREVASSVRDAQRLHRLVLSGFGAAPHAPARAAHGVLFRLDVDSHTGSLVLLVQSTASPDWSALPRGVLAPLDDPNPAVRSLEPMLEALGPGTSLRFRLRANVTRKIWAPPAGDAAATAPRAARVPLRSDEHRVAWLVRKAEAAGFALANSEGRPEVTLIAEGRTEGQRNGARLTFEGVRFDGRLRITDVERFRATLRSGIGPAKAYGYGLLSIAPT